MQDPCSYCENCGSDATFTPTFSPEHQVQRCGRCGGWSYVGRVDADAASLYDRGYFNGGEYADYEASLRAQQRNFERKLRLLSRAGVEIGADTRLLEIGCATGAFLALLRNAGVSHLVGVEVSAYARERAQAEGHVVFAPTAEGLDDILRDLRPNLIVAWDVWEHLDRPATSFDKYLQVADARAVVALTTVDSSSRVAKARGPRWRQFHPPTHLHYPSRTSLRDFFDRRSMRIERHHSFGYHRPALEYLRVLGLERVVRGSDALRTWPIYLNLWDTQLVIARRLS